MSEKKNTLKTFKFSNNSNIILAIGMILILGMMIVPLPTFLLDVFLVMSITGALVMMFVGLYVLSPLDFSVFPGLLLVVTLFRLSLNVSTTRLILTQGYAGEIIEAFGSFVVGGNYVVGVVMFLILVIINFVVITKGSSRIAEVSARFTLDAMPGKQMAIDADLNAGLIDDTEARERRGIITREADFYGAMDGAAKFVRGDAIAGLLITSINILAGLAIGMFQRGLTFGDAASIYTLLTVGDGLVAQIPALIISTAAGIVITRATSEASLGSDIATQMIKQPKAIFIAAGTLGVMGLIPGLPFIPFTLIALLLAGAGHMAQKIQRKEEKIIAEDEETPSAEIEEKIEDFLHPDSFEIEIGYGLIPMVDVKQGNNLLGRISAIRKSLAIEMGVIIPPIRIRDNIQIKSNEYIFKIYGIEIAKSEVMIGRFLVLNPDDRTELEGITTMEPTFGLKAIWISKNEKEKAELAGYTVVEPPAIIATHLMEVLKTNVYKLLDRQETQEMLEHLKKTHPAAVEGLVPDLIPLGVVTQILKNLLKEKIPIRNLVLILETIADYAPFSKDPGVLTEYVRSALSETITDCIKQDDNQIIVSTFEPRLEDAVMESVKSGNGQAQNLGFSPNQVSYLFENIAEKIEQMVSSGSRPVLLVSPQIRRVVRNFIEPVLSNVSIVSYAELTSDTNIKSIGMVSYPNEN